jgi:hypothetical protein
MHNEDPQEDGDSAVEEQDEDEKHRRRFGVRIAEEDAPEIRRILRDQIARGDDADELVMRLCCVELFSIGREEDIPLIWRAKMCHFDAGCSIDIQLLCGAGLKETISYLKRQPDDPSAEALGYLAKCVESGDFQGFAAEGWLAAQVSYYSD